MFYSLACSLVYYCLFIIHIVTVTFKSGQTTATDFEGVLLEARGASNPDTIAYYGAWDILTSNLKTMDCGSGAAVSVTKLSHVSVACKKQLYHFRDNSRHCFL